MTAEQKKRFEAGKQPVVKLKDNRSKLGKVRQSAKRQRYLDRKRKQREGNQRANGRRNA